jgi:hypothetical protein
MTFLTGLRSGIFDRITGWAGSTGWPFSCRSVSFTCGKREADFFSRQVRHEHIARPERMKMIGIQRGRYLNREDAKVAKKTRFKHEAWQQDFV